MVVSSIMGPVVAAQSLQDQINALEQKKNQTQNISNGLAQQAQGIQGEINSLRDQIASIQSQIDINTVRQSDLNKRIDVAQKKLAEQKDMLSANIRSMYIEGDISPLEMIASSKNLGDFVDKQEYRDRIKQNIVETLDEIERLKIQLGGQKKEITKILNDQKSLRGSLSKKNNEAGAKLASVNQSKAGFDSQIQAQSAQITALREQQRAANSRFIGAPGSGAACGGGYPGHAVSNFGSWGCNYGLDQGVDSWGMYNRECVSYTAFKVAQSGRNMPYWGGRGNAKNWPSNARGAGIPVDSSPRVGDVAISTSGYYGHSMYVESVNSNGTINISQYNVAWDGRYTTATISPSGLEFIHF